MQLHPLRTRVVSASTGQPSHCPDCRDHLSLHIPDVQLPNRMLGACEGCKAWYLIDCEGQVMVRLPDEGALRRAVAEQN